MGSNHFGAPVQSPLHSTWMPHFKGPEDMAHNSETSIPLIQPPQPPSHSRLAGSPVLPLLGLSRSEPDGAAMDVLGVTHHKEALSPPMLNGGGRRDLWDALASNVAPWP